MVKIYALLIANTVGAVIAPPGDIAGGDDAAAPRPLNIFAFAAIVFSLVASLTAQLWITSGLVRHTAAFAVWRDRLPINVLLSDDPSWHSALKHALARPNLELGLLVALQGGLLFALFRCAYGRKFTRSAVLLVGAGLLAMIALAVCVPTITSGDVYGYVAYSRLAPAAAYNPTSNMFSGAFSVLNELPKHLWGDLEPAPYGPLWLAVAHATIGLGRTLFEAIIIDRVVNAAAFIGCIFLLRRLVAAPSIVALFALNPAIIFMSIADGHNDILALTLILLGLTLAGKRPALGVMVGAMAALVKLPYLPISFLALGDIRAPKMKAVLALALVGFVGVVSCWGGGSGYLNSLTHHVDRVAVHDTLLNSLTHAILTAAALSAVAAAAFFNLYFVAGAFLFVTFFAIMHPWYILSGLPYAVKAGPGAAVAFLSLLPAVAFAMDVQFNPSMMIRALFVGVVLITVYRLVRRRRTASPATRFVQPNAYRGSILGEEFTAAPAPGVSAQAGGREI